MLLKQSDINRPYEARGAARTLWSCRDEEILIEGPAGTGKSRALLEKGHYCCMRYPGCRVLLVRKTRESLTESILVTFEEKVIPPGSDILIGPNRSLRQRYSYPNGSQIVVGGLDKSSKIMSTEYDLILVFEATEITESEFEDLTTRCRNGVMPYNQVICDCNPDHPWHWLNQRCNKSKMTRLTSRHKDNPMLYSVKRNRWTKLGRQYRRKLRRLTGVKKKRLFKGIWAAAEGMVYGDFDIDVHVIEPFEIPKDWRRYRTVDFGFKNPFVCQWWAIDNDDRMYLYREIYMTHRLVEDHAADITAYSMGEEIEDTICDHDLEDRETLHRHGVPTVPAYKELTTGIDAVQARLRVQKDKRPRLFIFEDCLVERDPELVDIGHPICTEQEFPSYLYSKKRDSLTFQDAPVKAYDHGMDALRYAVAHIDNLSGRIVQVHSEEALTV